MSFASSILSAFLLYGCATGAFVPSGSQHHGARQNSPWLAPTTPLDTITPSSIRGSPRSTTARNMMGGESLDALDAASSLWLSTIDADIAKLSDNEFAPIFAGGILVMFGGVLSALVVGGILESKNNYAEIVADSYIQGGEDKAFWESLSEEESKKMKALLKKVKKGNEGIKSDDDDKEMAEPAKAVVEKETTKVAAAAEEKAPDLDIFSDYAEDA